MKVGRRVQINTAVIGDSNLIEIGDDTVIGGDVTLVAHSAERGNLVTGRVRIGSNVTVGLMAMIMQSFHFTKRELMPENVIATFPLNNLVTYFNLPTALWNSDEEFAISD